MWDEFGEDGNASETSLSNFTTRVPVLEHGLVENLSGIVGALSVILNILLVVYKVRRIRQGNVSSYIVQLLMIALIDLACGFALLVYGTIRVVSFLTLRFCAAMVFLGNSVKMVSQGNICCICIQRYLMARNLRKKQEVWNNTHVIIIVTCNVILAAIVLGGWMLSYSVVDAVPRTKLCGGTFVLTRKESYFSVVHFNLFASLVLILLADTICPLTVYELHKHSVRVEPAHAPATSNSSRSAATNATSCDATTAVSQRSRQRHRQAVNTIIIILLVFNISMIPVPIFNALIVSGFKMTQQDFSLCLMLNFAHVVGNPILIVSRTGEIKTMVKEDLTAVVRFIVRR